MKAQDILRDEVGIGWPAIARQHVVYEGVKPNPETLRWVAGNFYSPLQPRTRNAHIFEPPFEEAHHLVSPRSRLDEAGVGLDVIQDLILVLRELEKVIFLLE